MSIYWFWLCSFFVAEHGLSLVVESGGYSSVAVPRLLLLQSTGSGSTGSAVASCSLSDCSLWGSKAQAQQLRFMGSVALQHMGSSRRRNQTHAPSIGRQILNLWTLREAVVGYKSCPWVKGDMESVFYLQIKWLEIFPLLWWVSVQFNSVTQSCPTPCDPMECSTPGLPVHHQLLELAQTHVHWVSDAIQPSHPLLSPSPSIINLSQHQGLFKWVSSLHYFSYRINQSGQISKPR